MIVELAIAYYYLIKCMYISVFFCFNSTIYDIILLQDT